MKYVLLGVQVVSSIIALFSLIFLFVYGLAWLVNTYDSGAVALTGLVLGTFVAWCCYMLGEHL